MNSRNAMPRRVQVFFAIILLLLVLATSYSALKYFPAPFAWAAVFSATALFAAMKLTVSNNWRAIWSNAAIAVLSLGCFEAYLHLDLAPSRSDRIESLNGEQQSMTELHDILGFAPVKNQQGIWSRHIGDDLVFRSRYSIDGNGLRKMPITASEDLPCVFFFGGSYTFGSGVNDEETMPYLVAKDFEHAFRVFNFAYRGYGPHQMLAALEHNIYEHDLKCQPRYVIYQLIPDHVSRAAGFASWDTQGPKFELDERENAVQTGTFNKGEKVSQNHLERILNRSLTYQRLKLFLEPKADESSADLTFAILGRSRQLIRDHNPDGQLHIIYWPADQSLLSIVIEKLEADDFYLYPITDVLPNFGENNEQYRLHQYDGHPNRLAHRLIADFIEREILAEQKVD